MMQQVFNSVAVKDFRHAQERNAEKLLKSILDDEGDFFEAVRS